jgi:hypothetical protein
MTIFHASLFENGLNIFELGIVQSITSNLQNVKLSYINKLWLNRYH